MKDSKTTAEKIISIESVKLENVYLTLTLDTRRKEELLPVAVRINCNRTTYYHRTGYKCTLSQWQDLVKATGRGIQKLGSLYNDKEQQIIVFNKVKDAATILLNKDDFTMENLKAVLTGRSETNFSDVWLNIIESRRSEKRIGTANSYNDAYNSFTKHIGSNISFNRIGVELIEKWGEKMNVSNTTSGMYMRACRVAINECIRKGYLKQSQYPFGMKKENKITIQKGRSRSNDFINIATIKQIMNFKAPSKWNTQTKDAKFEAINYWMFSYLGNGLNLADMALLRYNKHYFQSKETELQFIRKKTAATTDEDIEVVIPLIPELKKILNKYGTKPKEGALIFPSILDGETNETKIKKIISQKNSNIADRLEVVCKLLKLPVNITMTYARHSYATNLTHAGVSEKYISQAMGHTVKNVTGGYISLFPPEKRMTFNKMLLE